MPNTILPPPTLYGAQATENADGLQAAADKAAADQILGFGGGFGVSTGAMEEWVSPQINFLAAPADYAIAGPPYRAQQLVGLIAVAAARFVLDVGAGSVTTGPTIQAGNDVPRTNLNPSQTLAAASLNNAIAAAQPNLALALTGPALPTALVRLTTQLPIFRVTAAATGVGLTLVGRILYQLVYIQV